MREAVIMAVSNGGAKRIEEYSPKADPEYGGGGAEKFAQFLTRELKPQIYETYRTQAGPGNTGLLGSSWLCNPLAPGSGPTSTSTSWSPTAYTFLMEVTSPSASGISPPSSANCGTPF